MADLTRNKPPSRLGKGPTAGSFKPGDPRINRSGRPRAGLAFAERVRERVDPDMVIELALRVAEDEKLTPTERLAALWPLIDRGYIKPPAGLDVAVTSSASTPARDWSKVPLAERRELLERLRGVPEIDSASASDDGPEAA